MHKSERNGTRFSWFQCLRVNVCVCVFAFYYQAIIIVGITTIVWIEKNRLTGYYNGMPFCAGNRFIRVLFLLFLFLLVRNVQVLFLFISFVLFHFLFVCLFCLEFRARVCSSTFSNFIFEMLSTQFL